MPNTPPLPSTSARIASRASATSSPKTRIRSSASITSCSVRRIASPSATTSSPSGPVATSPGSGMSGSATTWSSTVVDVGTRAGERGLGGLGHGAAGLVADVHGLVGGEDTARDERGLEALDRVVARLPLELVRQAVLALGVGRRVRVRPGDRGVDERRPDAGPHVADHLLRRLADLEVVGAVDRPGLQAGEPLDQLADRRRRLFGRRHRDGVAVVGHDEQDGEVLGARGVEALPELALGRGALAEADVGDLVAVGGQVELRAGERCSAPASAHPTAGMHWLPVGLDCVTTLRSRSPQWAGICRPPDAGSSADPTACRRICSAEIPRPSIRARSR